MVQEGTRADARANHERLLEAAREVFAERGLDADIREICQRAEVGMGTFYRHFANKDGLIAALTEEVVSLVRVEVEAALAESDPLAAIERLLDFMFAIAEEHRHLIQAFQNEGRVTPEKDDDQLLGQVARLFERACGARAIRSDVPPDFLVRSLRGLLLNYVDLRERWGAEEARRYSRALFMDALLAGPRLEKPFVMPSQGQIAAFCKRWNVVEFSLFGSVLRDDFRPDSDVDVMVTFAPDHKWTYRGWLDMKDELRELFDRDVDLVERAAVEESTNRFRKESILESATVVYAA
jgi:AcrR family transcriptional regulator/predicted nucleotidyltransferase